MVHKTVYLAGPIDGLSYRDGIEWRDAAREELAKEGIHAMSPQRGKDYLMEHKSLTDRMDFGKQEELFKDNPMSTAKGILTRDRFDAINCTVLLVNFIGAKQVSIGTVMEIAWAHLQGKPIVVCIDPDDEIHGNHPMLRETYSWAVPSLEMGVQIVKGIFAGY